MHEKVDSVSEISSKTERATMFISMFPNVENCISFKSRSGRIFNSYPKELTRSRDGVWQFRGSRQGADRSGQVRVCDNPYFRCGRTLTVRVLPGTNATRANAQSGATSSSD